MIQWRDGRGTFYRLDTFRGARQGIPRAIQHHKSSQKIMYMSVCLIRAGAPWGLTIVPGGGFTYYSAGALTCRMQIPCSPLGPMVLWNYTDLSDSRWSTGKNLRAAAHRTKHLDFRAESGSCQ